MATDVSLVCWFWLQLIMSLKSQKIWKTTGFLPLCSTQTRLGTASINWNKVTLRSVSVKSVQYRKYLYKTLQKDITVVRFRVSFRHEKIFGTQTPGQVEDSWFHISHFASVVTSLWTGFFFHLNPDQVLFRPVSQNRLLAHSNKVSYPMIDWIDL